MYYLFETLTVCALLYAILRVKASLLVADDIELKRFCTLF